MAARSDRWSWTRAAGWGRVVPPAHSRGDGLGRGGWDMRGVRYLRWVERLEVLADAVPTTGATIARTRLQR